VQITNDTADISSAMDAFVTAYNAVVGDLSTQEGNDSSGNAEPLYGDPTVSLMQTQLSEALLGGKASGAVSSITQLGVTVNPDGTLTYSDSDMQSTLDSNFSDVVGFLQNTGSFGLNFTSVLNGLSSTDTTGAVYLAVQQNTAEETTLNTDVSNEEALLATESTTLTTELNTANQVLQSIPSQLSEVSEMYSAVTGYDTNIG
jgi:flagellar hook-associated protein 2